MFVCGVVELIIVIIGGAVLLRHTETINNGQFIKHAQWCNSSARDISALMLQIILAITVLNTTIIASIRALEFVALMIRCNEQSGA